MKKLSLKNLKEQEMNQAQMKKVTGGCSGYYCGDYYCTYVNPNAVCCFRC
ncbi:MAG: TIGR04149 family rSAM-modified RiPP [Saonia sp.]